MAGLKAFITAALRKRVVLALVVGGVIFSSVYAFAATLTVNSNTLSAGNASVASASCTASVSAAYAVAYDASIPGYKVSTITLTGLTGCSGKTVTVDLTNTSNASLYSQSHAITAAEATANSAPLTVGSTVSAASVTGVSVAVTG